MKPQSLRRAGVLIMCAAFMAGCKKNSQEDVTRLAADSADVIHVVTATVEPRLFEDWGLYSADLRGVEDAVLMSPMPGGGRVDGISEVGRAVAKGEALCNIEGDRYHALLLQAQAAVDLAQGEWDRTRNNVEKGYVGKAMLDKAQLDFQNARVAVLQAQRAYEDSRCASPFAGVLVSRFVDQFQNAPPGTPTVRVANLSRLEAVVSIPESEAFAYRVGQKAEFQLLQGEVAPIAGRIHGLDRAVEARNRTVTARIELSNPGNLMQPGMVGRARILRGSFAKALVVPSQAILRLQDGTALMRVDGNRVHKVVVTMGPARGDSVLIVSGITAGDRIITVGAFQVSEGTKVDF